MPELPDLQVFSINLDRKLTGKKLVKISAHKDLKLNVSPSTLKNSLEGKKVTGIYREGKELRMAFGKEVLGLHLMLHGKLHWFKNNEPVKGALLELYFEEVNLALTDYQRYAKVELNPRASDVPDALSPGANGAFWKDKLQSKATIKNLLTDQNVVRGIGNAYADEILWHAGISPFSISNKIPREKIKTLSKSVKTVLTNAQKKISKAEPGIIGGEIRDFLKIHNAKIKESPSGGAIKTRTTGGRKTYYTDEQELFT